jgi:putative transposase
MSLPPVPHWVTGYGPTRIYSLLRRYLADPLLPQPPGRKRGVSQCVLEIDFLINEVIDAVYLTRQRPRISDIEIELRKRCRELGLNPPSRKAITARVRSRPQYEVTARREGHKAARDRFAPATGSLEADWPLALVQIDHTLVDVIVVDSVTRAPIQRPWLTLAIDISSRCVMGFASVFGTALGYQRSVVCGACGIAQDAVAEQVEDRGRLATRSDEPSSSR